MQANLLKFICSNTATTISARSYSQGQHYFIHSTYECTSHKLYLIKDGRQMFVVVAINALR